MAVAFLLLSTILAQICLSLRNVPYNHSKAMLVAYYMAEAYCDTNDLETWSCRYCEERPNFVVEAVLTPDDQKAFVGYDPDEDEIVVVFRGSYNIENWLSNLQFRHVTYPNVANAVVHKGFWNGWLEDLQQDIMYYVDVLVKRHPNSKILVTGHSLGGALAYISSVEIKDYLVSRNSDVWVNVITYGCPRFGNFYLAEYVESKIDINWRLTHWLDIVPTVPPKWAGYWHSKPQIWYNSLFDSESYKICPGGEDSECWYVGVGIVDHLTYPPVIVPCGLEFYDNSTDFNYTVPENPTGTLDPYYGSNYPSDDQKTKDGVFMLKPLCMLFNVLTITLFLNF